MGAQACPSGADTTEPLPGAIGPFSPLPSTIRSGHASFAHTSVTCSTTLPSVGWHSNGYAVAYQASASSCCQCAPVAVRGRQTGARSCSAQAKKGRAGSVGTIRTDALVGGLDSLHEQSDPGRVVTVPTPGVSPRSRGRRLNSPRRPAGGTRASRNTPDPRRACRHGSRNTRTAEPGRYGQWPARLRIR